MSGIAGIFNVDGAPLERPLLAKMLGTIAHRGPSASGTIFDGSLGMAYCVSRPAAAGSATVSIDGGNLSIVFDGRIYNRPELATGLEKSGHHFTTGADEELALQAYKEWGPDCVSRFNGDWAFAIWDRQKNELFCCRDRAGSQPFIYYSDKNRFIFASEVKALLANPAVPRRVDELQAFNYLMWDISKQPGSTFFENVHQLKPGHRLIVSSKELKLQRWWDPVINFEFPRLSNKEISDSIEHFSFLLNDSIKARLDRAESPAGISLSGGLESNAIAAFVKRLMGNSSGLPLVTFGCCFDEKRIDDRPYIEQAVKMLGADCRYIYSEAARMWESLPEIIRLQDEPSAVYSSYSRWCLMKAVKSAGIKVLFDGDGGDALLAGHQWLLGNYLLEIASRGNLPLLAHEFAGATSKFGIKELAQWTGIASAGAILSRTDPAWEIKARKWLFRSRNRRTDKIINAEFDARNSLQGLADLNRRYATSALGLNRVLYDLVQYFHWQPDMLAAPLQVEIFTPFWDYRLMEYALSLPPQLKIRDGWSKWILRQAIKDMVPEEIRLKPRKNGFGVPLKSWIISNKEPIIEFFKLEDETISRFINARMIVDLFDELLYRENTERELWRYINFALWLKIYF